MFWFVTTQNTNLIRYDEVKAGDLIINLEFSYYTLYLYQDYKPD